MIGRTYYEKGEPVVVLVRWADKRSSMRPPEHGCREVVSGTRNELPATGGRPASAGQSARNIQHSDDGRLAAAPRMEGFAMSGQTGTRSGPRNVLIQRATGEKVVRPFRGLRKEATSPRKRGA